MLLPVAGAEPLPEDNTDAPGPCTWANSAPEAKTIARMKAALFTGSS
jgi:hypothetical protein